MITKTTIDDKPIPVTILTGFLGAGKTTLLNYILRQQHGYKFGILVNEIGEIGIDGLLVENQREEIVQINNGCVCCTVRGDLVRGIQQLLKRGGFDYLLIETTGLADPGPIAQTFFTLPILAQFVRLDSIVTVVDAEQLDSQINEMETVREQLAMADFVLLNKTDLVTEKELQRIETGIGRINPHCVVFRTSHSAINLRELLDMNAFDVDRKLSYDPQFLSELRSRHHHEHEEISSLSFKLDQPLDAARFQVFVQDLSKRQKVFRSKGILSIGRSRRRAVFHGVNNRFTIFWDRIWQKGEIRQSLLVFIGRNLDGDMIQRRLNECLA